jgi:AraC-like DNA-binding protein
MHRCRILGAPWIGVYGVYSVSGRSFPKHWHDGYGVGFLESGAQRSASGRGQVEAFAGDVITFNPGEVHDGRPLGGPTRSWRMVCIEHAALAVATGARGAEIIRPVIRDARLVGAVTRLLRHLERHAKSANARSGVDALACEEALIDTCGLLLRGHGSQPVVRPTPSDDLRRVRDRLADDSRHPPALGELAAMTSLSKFQLLRRFRRLFGLPPHAWVLQRRVEHVRALILSGSSLAAAAAESGFADQSHMTRAFARHCGFTPGAWKRAMRAPAQ